jgi:hypothetical protein
MPLSPLKRNSLLTALVVSTAGCESFVFFRGCLGVPRKQDAGQIPVCGLAIQDLIDGDWPE